MSFCGPPFQFCFHLADGINFSKDVGLVYEWSHVGPVGAASSEKSEFLKTGLN
jgi:hypothetical protein